MFNIAKLPPNISWAQIFGRGLLAGIGFTMSIFISMLAFDGPAIRDIAKIAILMSMALSVIISVIYFRVIDRSSVKDKNEL